MLNLNHKAISCLLLVQIAALTDISRHRLPGTVSKILSPRIKASHDRALGYIAEMFVPFAVPAIFRLVSDWSHWGMSVITYVSVPSPYTDIDECKEAEKKEEYLCGERGTCENRNGSYWCSCPQGYTNYGIKGTPCSGECTQFLSIYLLSCPHINLTLSLNKLPNTDVIVVALCTFCVESSGPVVYVSQGNWDEFLFSAAALLCRFYHTLLPSIYPVVKYQTEIIIWCFALLHLELNCDNFNGDGGPAPVRCMFRYKITSILQ